MVATPYHPPSQLLTMITATRTTEIWKMGTRNVQYMVNHHCSCVHDDGDVGGDLIVTCADVKVLLYAA